MCGRIACTLHACRIQKLSGARHLHNSDKYRRKYNVCPSARVPIAYRNVAATKEEAGELHEGTSEEENLDARRKSTEGELEVCFATWGLIPSFAKEAEKTKYKTINARVEGLTSSNLYRRLLHRKRCVVLCDGFFEWHKTKQTPHFFRHVFKTDKSADNKTPVEVFCLTDQQDDGTEDWSGSRHSPTRRNALEFVETAQTPEEKSLRVKSEGFISSDPTRKKQEDHMASEQGSKTDVQSLQQGERAFKRIKAESKVEPKSAADSNREGAGKGNASQEKKEKDEIRDPQKKILDRLEEAQRVGPTEELKSALTDDEMPLVLAGLYDICGDTYSVSIVTMSSQSTAVEHIHDRMPLLLTADSARMWLSSVQFEDIVSDVITQSTNLGNASLLSYSVNPAVAKPGFNHISSVLPIEKTTCLITHFFKPHK